GRPNAIIPAVPALRPPEAAFAASAGVSAGSLVLHLSLIVCIFFSLLSGYNLGTMWLADRLIPSVRRLKARTPTAESINKQVPVLRSPHIGAAMEPRRQGFYLFVGIFLLYLSLSPLTTQATGYQFSMGYQCTNLGPAEYIAAKIAPPLPYQRPTNCSLPFWLPVNGLLEPVLETPLILPTLPLGELWSERIASLEPILLSSLLVLIVFIWSRQIAPSWAFPLTLTFALATIVWPYAYLGMEPAQSLFLLLSAYLALGWKRPRRWWTATAFAMSCALAISLKSSGIALIPAT